MIRVRFKTDSTDDYRPVSWPIKHPYWCTGYGGDDDDSHAIIVAYAGDTDEIMRLWPEAYDLDILDDDAKTYTFTGRFPRPEWMEADDDGVC